MTVGADEADRTLTSAEAASLISSGDDLVKKGGGRLIINQALTGYKGSILVQEGYLQAATSYALGDADKGQVTVSDGATLEFGSADELLFGARPVSVCGKGVNGVGAMRHVGTAKDQWREVFKEVTLTGDTRFGGVANGSSFRRWDVRNGTLDMGGHDLELACRFGLQNATVANPGNITLTNLGVSARFDLEGTVTMGGSSANVLTVSTNCVLFSQKFKPALAWSVVIDGGRLGAAAGSSGALDEISESRIDGPVTVTEKGVLFYSEGDTENNDWSFGGPVTANGSVNAWNSGVRVHVLQAADDAAGERMAALDALRAHATSAAHSYIQFLLSPLSGDETTPLVSGGEMDSGWHAFAVGGAGALALTNGQAGTKYYQRGGYVKMTGADKTHRFSDVVVTGDSTLDWASAGEVDLGTNRVDVGAAFPAVAKLKIADTLVTTNWADKVRDAAHKLDGAIRIGPARNATSQSVSIPNWGGTRGVLEIGEGACVTGLLHIGYAEQGNDANRTHHGSLIQRGGALTLFSSMPNGSYAPSYVGHCGSGYMETSGGSLQLLANFHPGAGQRGRGVWYVTGGSVLAMNSPIIFGQYSRTAAPSKSVFCQTGGKIESWGGFVSGKTLWDGSNSGNADVFTFAGGTAILDNGFDLAGAPNATSILNLRTGGSLEAYWVQLVTNETQTIVGPGSDKAITGNRAWVNFDGGTLKYRGGERKKLTAYAASKAQSFFFGDPERLTVTAFAGGAAFDTSGWDVNLDHSIEAPTGRGLKSLAFASGASFADGTWVGAPVVEISGDGSGASAIAEFDSVHNRVTGFTVTSPGRDYTTMTATLTRGGYTNDVPLVVTLTDADTAQTSGGLVKKGNGTLSLNAANTYGGATRVEGGTLKAAHANAIPAGSAIQVAGGTVDFGGFARDFGAVAVTGGAIENATGTMDSLVKTGDGTFFLNAPVTVSGLVDVQDGTLKLPALAVGLTAGEVRGDGVDAAWSANQKPDNLGSDLGPSLVYELCASGGYYAPVHYVSYSGYVWNRSSEPVAWTFAYAFDDWMEFRLGGTKVTATSRGTASWGNLQTATVTLAPGATAFHLKAANKSGDGGAVPANFVAGATNWRSDLVGFAYDASGRNSTDGADYVHMTDPGDGSLFTRSAYDGSTMPTLAALRLAPGTTLDLCDGVLTLTGELRFGADAAADPVSVTGRLVFGEGATVTVEGLADLSADVGNLVLATATDGFGGTLPTLADDRWRLRRSADGKSLLLKPVRGSVFIVR